MQAIFCVRGPNDSFKAASFYAIDGITERVRIDTEESLSQAVVLNLFLHGGLLDF